jgi:hypothetical protein
VLNIKKDLFGQYRAVGLKRLNPVSIIVVRAREIARAKVTFLLFTKAKKSSGEVVAVNVDGKTVKNEKF